MKVVIDGKNPNAPSPMEHMQARFREYLKYTSKTVGEAVSHHAKEVIEACFIMCPRANPSVIKAKLESLGWQFKRAPRSYAAKFKGKGGDAAKAAAAERKRLFEMLNVHRKPRQKRTDAISAALEANPEIGRQYQKAMRLTLEEEQYAALQFRVGHIGAMASSWRPALHDLGSKMRIAAAEKRVKMRPMCYAEISDDMRTILVVNEMPGMVELIERTGYVEAAYRARAADMDIYIARKMQEGANILNPSGAK